MQTHSLQPLVIWNNIQVLTVTIYRRRRAKIFKQTDFSVAVVLRMRVVFTGVYNGVRRFQTRDTFEFYKLSVLKSTVCPWHNRGGWSEQCLTEDSSRLGPSTEELLLRSPLLTVLCRFLSASLCETVRWVTSKFDLVMSANRCKHTVETTANRQLDGFFDAVAFFVLFKLNEMYVFRLKYELQLLSDFDVRLLFIITLKALIYAGFAGEHQPIIAFFLQMSLSQWLCFASLRIHLILF